jgi:hypothetical protein
MLAVAGNRRVQQPRTAFRAFLDDLALRQVCERLRRYAEQACQFPRCKGRAGLFPNHILQPLDLRQA